MSTGLHDSETASPENIGHVDIKLGRRRRWLIPAAVAAVVVIAAAVTTALTSGGPSARKVAGSHFGNELQVAYEADSGSERAFLEYLNKTVAPTYGVQIVPVGIGDGNQLDQATANGQYAANIYQHKHWLRGPNVMVIW
jgi:D-methionine transport system substrate-binding protein